MVSAALIALCAILVFASLKTTYWILKVFAGLSFWGLGMWWVYNPFTTAGSPPHVITLVVLFFSGVAMFFLPFWYTKNENGVEAKGRIRLPFMPTDEENEIRRRSMPTRTERTRAYQDRLNVVLRGGRRR